jgi:dolichyl-phosphate beta-glucosyltransferase
VSVPELSVVIPAFNEEERLPESLGRVLAYLEQRGDPFEILVVDDGSKDRTVERALAVCSSVVLVRNPQNRGKGHAVRQGMLLARGRRRLMTDADLSTPIEELERLLSCMDEGYDVVIGSRALAGARIEVHQPRYRESLGRLFNLLVRWLVVPGLHDTQCGFKLFTGEAARVFEVARLNGFCFDVEALFVARRRGLRIAELPVTWRNDAATRVTTLRGALAFGDLLRIRWNAWRGRYPPASAPRPA